MAQLKNRLLVLLLPYAGLPYLMYTVSSVIRIAKLGSGVDADHECRHHFTTSIAVNFLFKTSMIKEHIKWETFEATIWVRNLVPVLNLLKST